MVVRWSAAAGKSLVAEWSVVAEWHQTLTFWFLVGSEAVIARLGVMFDAVSY